MCEPICTPNIYSVPGTQTNLSRLFYVRDGQTNPNEEFYHLCVLNAPVTTPLPLYMIKYIERYQTCFDVGSFRQMPSDVIEWPVTDHFSKHRDQAVAGWPEH